ncbi:MAG: hypothetical protein WKF77_23950 [Planctomycetaceae bacterium]
MAEELREDLKRLFLHYPAGNRIYVMVVVDRHLYFDFSDYTSSRVALRTGVEYRTHAGTGG